jgi:hypothetical protein
MQRVVRAVTVIHQRDEVGPIQSRLGAVAIRTFQTEIVVLCVSDHSRVRFSDATKFTFPTDIEHDPIDVVLRRRAACVPAVRPRSIESQVVVGEDGVDLVGDGFDQVGQEVCSRFARHLLVQLDEGELRGPVDRDDEIELALSGSDLGEVDMEIADRIGLELALRRGFAFDLRQARDLVTLKASMQRRARQMRDCRLKRVEAVVERQQGMCSS